MKTEEIIKLEKRLYEIREEQKDIDKILKYLEENNL